MKTLNEWAKEIHENAVAHGWWDEPRRFGEIVALCHSELSEALEEFRVGCPLHYYKCKLTLDEDNPRDRVCTPEDSGCGPACDCTERCDKPEGVAVEMIDCLIRILDWCAAEGVDVDGLLIQWKSVVCSNSALLFSEIT